MNSKILFFVVNIHLQHYYPLLVTLEKPKYKILFITQLIKFYNNLCIKNEIENLKPNYKNVYISDLENLEFTENELNELKEFYKFTESKPNELQEFEEFV
jgi:hypothetical protein